MTKSPLSATKNRQGVKRSLLTDVNGLPLSLVVAAASMHDIELVADTLDALQTGRPGQNSGWLPVMYQPPHTIFAS